MRQSRVGPLAEPHSTQASETCLLAIMGATKPAAPGDRPINLLTRVQHGGINKPATAPETKRPPKHTNLQISNLLNDADDGGSRGSGINESLDPPEDSQMQSLQAPRINPFFPSEDFISRNPHVLPTQPIAHTPYGYPTTPIPPISKPISPPPTENIQTAAKTRARESYVDMDQAADVVYVLQRAVSGTGVAKEHDILGVFDDLQAANEAAPKLLGRNYLDDEVQDYNKEILEDGRISLHATDGDFVFDLVVQKTEHYWARAHGIGGEDVYVVERTHSGNYIDSVNEVLGTFRTLDEANEAAPRLVDRGYEGLDLEEYEEEFSEDGGIKITAVPGDFEYFDLVVRRVERQQHIKDVKDFQG